MEVKHWDTRNRKQLKLYGRMPSRKALDFPFTIIAGPTCSGKSTFTNFLFWAESHLIIPKISPRKVRPEEESDVPFNIPFNQISESQWYALYNVPRLESFFVGCAPPYPEWDYWARQFSIIKPSREEIVLNRREFVLIYEVCDIEQTCRDALNRGRGIVIGLFLQDAVGWKRVFHNSRIICLDVDPYELKKRIDQRWGLDDMVPRARLLDGASTPPLEAFGIIPDLVMKNNTREESFRNTMKVMDFSGIFHSLALVGS